MPQFLNLWVVRGCKLGNSVSECNKVAPDTCSNMLKRGLDSLAVHEPACGLNRTEKRRIARNFFGFRGERARVAHHDATVARVETVPLPHEAFTGGVVACEAGPLGRVTNRIRFECGPVVPPCLCRRQR